MIQLDDDGVLVHGRVAGAEFKLPRMTPGSVQWKMIRQFVLAAHETAETAKITPIDSRGPDRP